MKLSELKQQMIIEYDSRELKSKVRYNALDKVIEFLKGKYEDKIECISVSLLGDKDNLKNAYKEYKGKDINGAENSVINEIYNQLRDEPVK